MPLLSRSIIVLAMWFLLAQLILRGAQALPASQSSPSCAHDDLFTALSRDGQGFCASMAKTACEDLVTPTQFTTYASTRLSSYCDCVLTSCTAGATASPGASGSKHGSDASTQSSSGGGGGDNVETSVVLVTMTHHASNGSKLTTNRESATTQPSSGGNGVETSIVLVTLTDRPSNNSSATTQKSVTTQPSSRGNSVETSLVLVTLTDRASDTESSSTEKGSKTSSGDSSDSTGLASIQTSLVLVTLTDHDSSVSSSQVSGSNNTGSSTGQVTQTSSGDDGSSTNRLSVQTSLVSVTLTDTKSSSSTGTLSQGSGSNNTGQVTQTSTGDANASTNRVSIQTSLVSVTLTDPASGNSTGSGSDTRSLTGKATQTTRGSFKETTTSGSADASSIDVSATGTGAVTLSTLSTSGGDEGSTALSQTSTSAGGGETSSITSGQSSKGSAATQGRGTGSWGSGSVPPVLNATSTWTLNGVPGAPTGVVVDSTTQASLSDTSAPGSSSASSATWSTITTSTAPTSPPFTSPPFITPPGFNTSTLTHSDATQTAQPTLPAANFTQVTRTAAISKPSCYQMPEPEGGSTRRALLHNANLRERNATIPFPYIESVDFDADGIYPFYFTVRDAAEGSHFIDVSNRSYIAIVDSLYNAMIIDAAGIHFSTKNCLYDVSITIDSMYKQLAKLSGQVCSAGDQQQQQQQQQRKRMSDKDFTQTLFIRDQCNNPVKPTLRKYPELKVGDSDCNDIAVDEATGRWLFDCTFPGSDSGTSKCQRAVRYDIEKFLFTDPFGGACPDLSTVITTLEANGQDFINPESLRAELYNQGLSDAQRAEADLSVMYYEQLWEILEQAFSKLRTQTASNISAIQEYIDVYNQYRSFEDDICDDLHAGDMPLKMSLRAGVTHIDAVAMLNWAPENPKPFNVTVQDPSKMACCPRGAVASTDEATGICAYPFGARIGDTGCVCGQTASGASVAFEFTECENLVSECEVDGDCARAGHPSHVCLTGSCCGGGVCVDPYQCSQNGTVLVRNGLF